MSASSFFREAEGSLPSFQKEVQAILQLSLSDPQLVPLPQRGTRSFEAFGAVLEPGVEAV